jgi:ABC-type glycerol-3-phosphate transport system permease component
MPGRLHPILTFAFAALILLFTGGPVLLSLYGSLVPDRVLLSPDQSILTEGPSFETYRYVFTGQLPDSYLHESANRAMISDAARQVPGALINSSVNALAAMILNLILGAPAAFVFARYVFPGKRLSFMYLILSPLVPAVALVTPIYMMLEWLGLVGTPVGIVLVHTAKALPFTALILSVFFRKIPAEIFEAAELDHCGRFQAFWRIALPVSVVMAALARNTDVSWSLLNTGIFIAVLPTLVLVILVWRFVVEGLVSGAVKG